MQPVQQLHSRPHSLQHSISASLLLRRSRNIQPSETSLSTIMAGGLLDGMPHEAPKPMTKKPRFADIAVTATAKDFAGIYRGKQHHEPDVPAMLDRAHAAGVEKVILTGMSLSDIDFNLQIAQSKPEQCLITVGVHPYHAAEPENDPKYLCQMFTRIQELRNLSPYPLAAFGELGLDYDHLEHASKEVQTRTFERQLELYIEHKLDIPLFLHCRASFDNFVRVITPYLTHLHRRGVVHSFVGTTEQMQTLVSLGFDISVNGFSFRDRESLEMVRDIPLDKLQLETDSPWGEIPASSDVAKRYLTHARPLPTSKKRDKFEVGCAVKGRNESYTMERVAMVVAGLKGLPVEQIADAAWANSQRMFGFKN